jgi:hypothetical protein
MRPGHSVLAALAVPVLAAQPALGVQVATVRGPVPAPGGPYTLHAVVPTPTSVTGPIFVGNNQTESRLIGSTLTQNYHEVFALVPGGGTGPFAVNTEGSAPTQSYLVPMAEAAFTMPDAIVLVITDTAGATHPFPITSAAPANARWIVNHRLAKVHYQHMSLGQFGYAHVWMILRAGLRQIDVILNWHASIPGTQDVLFKNARIVCPNGVVWMPNLADSVGSLSASRFGFLVKPTGTGSPHVIPQRHERAFRFSVYPAADTYRKPWAWNGMADWTTAGFALAGFKAPASISGANLDAEATQWRNGLQTLAPWYYGNPPVSPLWPAAGALYGGVTSGLDMAPLDGVRWLVTGQVSGFERFATEQLRMHSRIRGSLFEPNGDVVRPYQHLSNGNADWRMYDSIWERQSWPNQHLPQDGPFDFPLTRLLSQAAYNPEVFAPTDCQHIVREWNQNAILAMAAADPLAMHYLKMEAAKTLMTYWPGPGNANRFGAPPQAGKGISMDRGWAWAAMVIAHNYVWSTPTERLTYDPWIQKLIDYLQTAQMPSGMFGVYPGAKESKNPPFSAQVNGTPLYIIDSGLGECYFALTLSALTNISAYAGARAPQMMRQQAAGFRDIAWAMGTGGVWYTFAVGPNDGSNTRYLTRAQWPADLAAGMVSGCATCPYSDGYHVGYAIAALKKAGATQADELLFRFTGRSTVSQALSAMDAWGVGNGTPVEQFWPARTQWP